MLSRNIQEIQGKISYFFRKKELLFEALCHESFSFEHKAENKDELKNNERLEFLGDAVLGLIITHELYEHHPTADEGVLSRMKSYLVSSEHLVRKANELDLGRFILLGKGELASHGRKRHSILADALEALLGAVYLDGGLKEARRIVLKLFGDDIKEGVGSSKDTKSELQELLQRYHRELPVYRVVSEQGPPHSKTFTVEVSFRGQVLGKGEGPSKQSAGRQAAREALSRLNDEGVVESLGKETQIGDQEG